jgi:AcrR family transcriptional regulator
MTVPDLSPVKVQRRQKMLDAAEMLFVTQGFRSTTMEAIALAADMSKVTVYGYFSDKDAVFAAVADRLAAQLVKAVSAALEGEGSVRDRVAQALIAKHRIIFDLVRRSPHAGELFAAKDRMSLQRFEDADMEIEALIAEGLRASAKDPNAATLLARLLFAASQGIANRAERFDDTAQGILTLCRLIEDVR